MVRKEDIQKTNEENTLGGNISPQLRYLSQLVGLGDLDANRSSAVFHEERAIEAIGKRSLFRVCDDAPSAANQEEHAIEESGKESLVRVPLGASDVALDK